MKFAYPMLVLLGAINCTSESPAAPPMIEGSSSTGDASSSGEFPDASSTGIDDPPSPCGNFDLDPGEECDDGIYNMSVPWSMNKACRVDCTWSLYCGDDVCNGDEDAFSCTGDCPAECGNRIVEPGEECDSDPECNDDCTVAVCGDGKISTKEECDNGVLNADSNACTATCHNAVCGDGLLHEGVEECDDGDEDFFDECSSWCFQPRRVFVSSVDFKADFYNPNYFDGGFSGLARADFHCNNLAKKAGVPGKYRAWASSSAINARQRMEDGFQGAYINVDGTVLARGWVEFRSVSGLKDVIKNEYGAADLKAVWTGTNLFGDHTGTSCSDWSVKDPNTFATHGFPDSDDWSEHGLLECINIAGIYCVQTEPI